MRNRFEEHIGDALLPHGFTYESTSIQYPMYSKYTPDFVLGDLWVESKGWFRPGDTKKYKSIRDALTVEELVFLLQHPKKKVRKGSIITMSDWCDKEGLKWFTLDTLEELIEYGKGKRKETSGHQS